MGGGALEEQSIKKPPKALLLKVMVKITDKIVSPHWLSLLSIFYIKTHLPYWDYTL